MKSSIRRRKYISVKGLGKAYGSGNAKIDALKDANFEINKGEICVILGASGAGKTTLLNLLGGMDNASSGSIELETDTISEMNKRELTKYRREDIGFVFQFYNLIPNLTALENVELATQICISPMDAAKALDLVGLTHRLNNFPAQLSGGEQQRVSIARAIAKIPKLLLCDEPTGALDYDTGKSVLTLLQNISRERGMTVVIITHNQAISLMADRIIEMKSGKVSSSRRNENVVPISEIDW